MADIDMTSISSKGQIVIPSDMRKDFREGERLIIIKSGKRFILTRVKDFDDKLKEDLIFAKRTEGALRRYERGRFKKVSGDEFLQMLERW